MSKTVLIGDDTVTVRDPDSMPEVRVMSLAAAWAGSGHMLFVRNADTLVGLLRTLAPRFDDARARVWRDLRPVARRRFEWTWDRGGGREPVRSWIELDGDIARRPSRSHEPVDWQTIDDLYVHGPSQVGVPADVRAALVAHLGLDPADAFPLVEHAAIAPRSWSWNQREDGEEGLSIGGPSVVMGYQYQHDIAWGEYPVERVITRAADIYVAAPESIQSEMRALLAAAVRPAVE
ncbi:MAG TPA: hypothetical protein VM261_33525 [Kofleriaceae bacterium]|nr:hypothetical protein [Kofleriaceae bacterium]